MKNTNCSQPYRNLGFGKIEAPVKKEKTAPKSNKINGKDLRIGGNQKK